MFDFKILTDEEQTDLLLKQGAYIGKRICNDMTMVLYQLEGFYIEISYTKYRHHISSIRCSAGTAILEPYLEQMEAYAAINSNQ